MLVLSKYKALKFLQFPISSGSSEIFVEDAPKISNCFQLPIKEGISDIGVSATIKPLISSSYFIDSTNSVIFVPLMSK